MEKTWVEINRSYLRHNVVELKKTIGQSKLMAVVKANAYGHGLGLVVKSIKSLPAVSWFGVDSLDEALAVRGAGAKQSVLIMGYVPSDRLREAVYNKFSMVVYEEKTIKNLANIASKRNSAKLHLKLETGTSRQGVLLENIPKFARLIKKHPSLILEGVSTHYANIEDTVNPTYAMGQLSQYQKGLAILESFGLKPTIRHTAATAAGLLYPVTRFEMVRAGIALYGLWPSENTKKIVLANNGPDLKPALTWKTVVAQVKPLPKGTPVSYGLTEKLKRDSIIAVLPVGYWDGLGRELSSNGYVLINGKRAKILGRVCMNMVVVDVTDCGKIKQKDEVVIIGKQKTDKITAEDQATWANTINYEIVTKINPGILRVLY